MKITEKDIHYILKESIKKLNEYSTNFGPVFLEGIFNIFEYVYDYTDVDEGVVEGFFIKYSIPQEVEYGVQESGGVFGAGPDDFGGEVIVNEESLQEIEEIYSRVNQLQIGTPEERKICELIKNILLELESPDSVRGLEYELGNYFLSQSYNEGEY